MTSGAQRCIVPRNGRVPEGRGGARVPRERLVRVVLGGLPGARRAHGGGDGPRPGDADRVHGPGGGAEALCGEPRAAAKTSAGQITLLKRGARRPESECGRWRHSALEAAAALVHEICGSRVRPQLPPQHWILYSSFKKTTTKLQSKQYQNF